MGCNTLTRAVSSHFLHTQSRRVPTRFGYYLSWESWRCWAGPSPTVSLHSFWLPGLCTRAEDAWEGERLEAWITSERLGLLSKQTESPSFGENHLSDPPKCLKQSTSSPLAMSSLMKQKEVQALAFHTYPCPELSVNWNRFSLDLHGLCIIGLSDYLRLKKYYFSYSLLCSKEIKITLTSYQYSCESTVIKQFLEQFPS